MSLAIVYLEQPRSQGFAAHILVSLLVLRPRRRPRVVYQRASSFLSFLICPLAQDLPRFLVAADRTIVAACLHKSSLRERGSWAGNIQNPRPEPPTYSNPIYRDAVRSTLGPFALPGLVHQSQA